MTIFKNQKDLDTTEVYYMTACCRCLACYDVQISLFVRPVLVPPFGLTKPRQFVSN